MAMEMETLHGEIEKLGSHCYAVFCLGVLLIVVAISHFGFSDDKDPTPTHHRRQSERRFRALHLMEYGLWPSEKDPTLLKFAWTELLDEMNKSATVEELAEGFVQVKAHLSKMDGESLDRLLSSTNVYKAILFYASWCPFSRNAQPKFDALAAMYPHKLSMHTIVNSLSKLSKLINVAVLGKVMKEPLILRHENHTLGLNSAKASRMHCGQHRKDFIEGRLHAIFYVTLLL
ncbi:hypothetical protein L6452_29635 [Arctium lappa]|uniref:Uncharacterized protein n=1 Tax=Arctium lappa TaxID=4217 RepID=A0ACB8ZLF5_ARCLA|nr:hypothetical protein L6452_29635 [Arctium lappa]